MSLSKADKQLLESKKFVIIYGAGYYGELWQNILNKMGLDITCFVVSDDQEAPSSVNGKTVKFLSMIDYEPDDTAFILTLNKRYWNEVKRELERKKYTCILGVTQDDFRELYVKECKKYLSDRKIDLKISEKNGIVDFGIAKISRETFSDEGFWGVIGEFILPYFKDYSLVGEGPYEIEPVTIEPNDIILDCGANAGIFSAIAAQRGKEVYAFEPVPATREYLQKNADLYPNKLYVESYALADKNGESVMTITEDPAGNTLLQGRVIEIDQITVPVITIDQFVAERSLPRVDFIKADIEGAERLMLAGAQETLRRFAPKLAICTYHLPDDKEVLENLIKQANPDYIVTHRWKKLYAYVPEEKRQQLFSAKQENK